MSYIPWGLFFPLEEDAVSAALPLVAFALVAGTAAIPISQVKGVWVGVACFLVSFLAMCFMRRWIILSSVDPVCQCIMADVWNQVKLLSLVLPVLIWLGAVSTPLILWWKWKFQW